MKTRISVKNRDRIIRYYKGTDNGELAARLIDLADSTAKGRPYAVSEFVSPGAVQIGETIQAHEFHYSDSTSNGNDFIIKRPNGKQWEEIHMTENIFAVYN